MQIWRSSATWFVAAFAITASAAFALVVIEADEGRDPPFLDAGLGDKERDEKYRGSAERDAATLAAIADEFNRSGASLNTLTRAEAAVSVGGSRDLLTATREAQAIFSGRVLSQRIDAASRTIISTVEVSEVLDGNVPAVVEVKNVATIEPTEEGEVVLVYVPNDPPPLEGTDIVVFAASVDSEGRIAALPYKILTIAGGKIYPQEDDTAIADLKGQTLDEFVAAISDLKGDASVEGGEGL